MENLNNLELLDLSGNINIEEIPDFFNSLPKLKTVKLTGCRINKFSKSASKFFWMGQNFRYYTNYSIKDINYYEKYHTSKASNSGRLYKNFVKWLFKLKNLMKKCNFDYSDIEKFEKKTNLRAIHSGKPIISFLRYLDDKKQTRITKFL